MDNELFEWWKERHQERFIECLQAWGKEEDHSDENVRKNRIMFYLDQVGKGDIKQILMIRLGDKFVEMLDELYLSEVGQGGQESE
jgi:hypothetical protein